MEETRIVIIHKPESGNISVYINNPHADREELLVMMSAHIAHSIRNMILSDVSFSEAVATVECAVELAVSRFTDK